MNDVQSKLALYVPRVDQVNEMPDPRVQELQNNLNLVNVRNLDRMYDPNEDIICFFIRISDLKNGPPPYWAPICGLDFLLFLEGI